ncbi:4328_t:CDS:2 [Ambispora leptoticha]|uniref:4328_t:CDS:1 n=1 Tax=Ambispora leptoticha TaxID=144679 RepID=A0A9N9E748_9GLOM|nr:4328_t:CDS:2 [Ambispora leptoticha]
MIKEKKSTILLVTTIVFSSTNLLSILETIFALNKSQWGNPNANPLCGKKIVHGPLGSVTVTCLFHKSAILPSSMPSPTSSSPTQ